MVLPCTRATVRSEDAVRDAWSAARYHHAAPPITTALRAMTSARRLMWVPSQPYSCRDGRCRDTWPDRPATPPQGADILRRALAASSAVYPPPRVAG